MCVKLTILGSGSGGNATYLECGKTRILIDAGLSGRQIRERLLKINRSPETLTGIIISHEHTDHIDGLAVIAAKLGIPVYTNRLTREGILEKFDKKFCFKIFQNGESFEIGDIEVEVFSVPHDAVDPTGFTFITNSGKIGFATDIGCVTALTAERFRSAQVLVVEANHDVEMLQNDPCRPWSLKQRIMGKHGHLSNESAAELIERTITENLQHITLAHLSQDCNRPELALKVINKRLQTIGATQITVSAASQDRPAPTIRLENGKVI